MSKNKIKLLFAALIVSLMANMFFLGTLVSSRHRPEGPPSLLMHITRAAQDLPPASREKVLGILRAHETTMRAKMDVMDPLFKQLEGVLTAPVFDPQAVIALHRQMEAADGGMKGELQSLIIALGQALPQDERIVFFRRILPPPFARGPGKDHFVPTENDRKPVL